LLHPLLKQRSILLFENSLKSEQTREQYLYYLNRFIKHFNLKDFDSILKTDTKDLVTMLEDYVIDLKNKVSPNTIPTQISPLQSFFEINDITINWKRIKKLFPARVKLTGRKAWTNADIKKMLEFVPDIRAKCLIHFLASTAVRIGSLEDIKLKHIEEMPHKSKSVLIYEGSTEEYYTFLTPESAAILDLYLEKRSNSGETLGPESPLFRNLYKLRNSKAKSLTKEGIESIMRRVARNAGLRKDKIGQRYSVQLDHGFRKRYATILKLNKEINQNSVEKLLGHKNGLDGVYFIPTRDELFEQFSKSIVDLTIDDSERVRTKNQQLEKENQELERKNSEISKLKQSLKEQIENQKLILQILTQKGILPS